MDNDFLKLVKEYRRLEKLFERTRHGPLSVQIKKIAAEMDHRLAQHFEKRDPQQELFEAK